MLEEHWHWEVESWVKSWEVQGLFSPCPLNAWGTAPNTPWPKARPLLRACSSTSRSELLPSAQPKRATNGKRDFTKEKSTSFANSTATASPPQRLGREHLSASSPSISIHKTKYSPLPHQPRPTGQTSQRLLLLATTPISIVTWLCGASDASFLSSPLPTLHPTGVKCCIINPCKSRLVLEQRSFVICPFLAHSFCQHCHCTSRGNVSQSGQSKVPTKYCNSSPPNDSWALLWVCIYFQNRFGSLVKILFSSTKWQGEEKSGKLSHHPNTFWISAWWTNYYKQINMN